MARDLDTGPGGARVGRALRVRAGLTAVLLAALLGACSLLDRPPEILDGLSVGGDAGCGACDQPSEAVGCGACESIAELARRHVDEESHGPIAAMSFHREGWYPGPNGEKILSTRSGTRFVVVVTFVDGSRHAVAVYCGVGGCR
jgi:hypothetical protein